MKTLMALMMSLNFILAPVAHAQGQGYAKQILGLANGIAGSTIIVSCRLATMQPSLMIYMAGSVAYIGYEVIQARKQGQTYLDSSAQIAELQANGVQDGNLQREAIAAQLRDEKAKKESARKRKLFMTGVAAVYATALGWAVFEWLRARTSVPPIPDTGACRDSTPAKSLASKAVVAAFNYGNGQASGGGTVTSIAGNAMSFAGNSVTEKFAPLLGISVDGASVSALNGARGRIVFFAAGTVLTAMIASDVAGQERKFAKNISDMEKLIQNFKEETKSESEISEDERQRRQRNQQTELKRYAVKELEKGQLQKSCAASTAHGIDFSPAACTSPMTLKSPDVSGFQTQLPTLVTASNLAVDMGNAIAVGDAGRAEVVAGELGAMAGRINEVNKALEKKINEQLKAKGEKPIDINKEAEAMIASMQADLEKSDAAKGMDLASTGEQVKSSPETKAADTTPVVVTSDAATEIALPDANLNFSEGSSATGSEDTQNGGITASLDQSLEQYESSEQDILKEPEVSIFKQVSNRYILNYQRIFKKKEITQPETKP